MKYYKQKGYKAHPDLSKAKELPILIHDFFTLIDDYKKENLNRVDDIHKRKLLNDLLERRIFDKLFFMNQFFKSPVINKVLTSTPFLSNPEKNELNEHHYLKKLLFHNYLPLKVKDKNMFAVYDSIPKKFKNKREEKIKMLVLEHLAQWGEKLPEIKKRLNQFFNDYNNRAFKNYLDHKYLTQLKDVFDSDFNMDYTDMQGDTGNLKSLIKSLKGKVIYIDFWASWCGPCRQAMPASRKLRRKYKNKEVVFLYFSFDKIKANWVKAAHEEGIKDYEHNYLVPIHQSSAIWDELHIEGIPRYLLLNKNGKLINPMAPGPTSKGIVAMINRALR